VGLSIKRVAGLATLVAAILCGVSNARAQAAKGPAGKVAAVNMVPGVVYAADVKAPDFPKPGAGVSGTTWIDSPPLTLADLRGKVVMLDFWEYTCINCIRTFAQTKEWYARYHKYGFEVIGVHDPEFSFAYKPANVAAAAKRFGLPYPVVADDWYQIWKSYGVEAWPERILLDANGNVRFKVIGEQGNRAFETDIRKLLVEAHPGLKFPASYTLPAPSAPYGPGCGGEPTDEMFVGPMYGHGNVVNPDPYHPGATAKYRMPAKLPDGGIGLSGKWQTDPNGMIFEGGKQGPKPRGARMDMRYHAAELYAVIHMWSGKPERLYIEQDGKWLTKADAGVDVRFDRHGRSYIFVSTPRMYYLVSNPRMASGVVDLIPTASGIMVDSFTFGNNCQRKFPHL
jgi:peroxiredoxin